MAKSTRLAYLFNRYYEKKATASEKDELFELLQHPDHDDELARLIDLSLQQDIPARLQDPVVADKILRHILEQHPSASPRPKTRRIPLVLRYAAAVLAAVLLTVLFWPHPKKQPAPAPILASLPALPTDDCITLSDGSKILLHGSAHIQAPRLFEGKTREITLSGEAYFDIRSDPRPFIVHTGKIKTTVLGTAFNINADTNNLVVTVLKGKVKVENNTGGCSILRHNEQVSVDLVHLSLIKTQVNAGEAIAWKKPYLLFNDITMREAVDELQQRFHASVKLVNPATENCRVTATFTRGEPLDRIIKVLTRINNMDYTQDADGSFELIGDGCK